jgi:hypothetical protein
MRDHINYRKNDRWRSYRFYKALQRLKSPMCDICEIFGAPRFSSFSTQSAHIGHRVAIKLDLQVRALVLPSGDGSRLTITIGTILARIQSA